MRFLSPLRKIRIADHKKTMLLGLLAMISLTAVLSVGPIYAYLKMTSTPAVNTFDAAPSATPEVNPDYTISVGDTTNAVGNGEEADTGYSVYVRAAVVVTWQNAAGEVYGMAPDASLLTLSVNRTNWTPSGNYYYYNTPVPSGETTQPLLTGDVTTTESAPESGYTLHVDILAQSIQAVGKKNGTDAVTDAWGWTPAA